MGHDMVETYIEEFRNLWDDRAVSYSEQVLPQISEDNCRRWVDEVLKDVPADQALDVLDVGCGPGFFSMVLGRMGHNVIGIDYNENMCKVAALNCQNHGIIGDFRVMDAHNLDFEDCSFDLVVSRDVLWNLDNPEKAYREMFRVLRPDGKITVFDGNYYLYSHDPAYAKFDVDKHIEIYHKDEPDCRDRLMRVADMATKLPASMNRRPQWDVSRLIELGARRVSSISYPDNEVIFTENGKTIHLPFIFSVSGFKGPADRYDTLSHTSL